MKITIKETIPECPDFRRVDAGEWQAEPATIQLPGRQRRECQGYDLRRRQPGYGWVSAALSRESWYREIENGNIIIQQEGSDMETTTAPSKICAALVKAQKAFGPALKTATNPHYKSKYADLGACVEAVVGGLHANGIALLQTTRECADGVIVATNFVHESGEILTGGELRVPAQKQDPQGYGSALTYARRYSLMTACGLAPEDDDGNAASGNGKKPAAKTAPVQSQDDGLRHAEPQAPQPADTQTHADAATDKQKKALFAKSIAKFGDREKALEFIKYQQGGLSYWTKTAISGLLDDFDAQAALFADSQRAA